jgi:hypothetical protein
MKEPHLIIEQWSDEGTALLIIEEWSDEGTAF